MASDIVATREKERGTQDGLSIPYFVRENDAALSLALEDAIAAAAAQATTDEGAAPGNFTYERIGQRVVRVGVEYKANDTTPLQPPETGDLNYRFNFQARGQYLYQALAYVAAYDADGNLHDKDPDYEMLHVNVQRVGGVGRVLGAQIDPAPEAFSLDYTAPNAVVTGTYQDTVAGLCGAFNSTTFRGKPPGSVQLVRASGRIRTNEDWQLSFGFGYVPEETSVDAGGGITIPSVLGSEYWWATTKEVKNDDLNFIEVVPRFVVLQQVWREENLNLLNLPA